MRIVIVNYSHPQYPHISAVRLSNFGKELAKLGCKVILLTSNFGINDSFCDIQELEKRLIENNYPDFFHIASPARITLSEKIIRYHKTPSILRKGLVAKNLLINRGSYIGWQIESIPYIELIAKYFQPTIVWATFVPLDSWQIAKLIAFKSNAKLVLDIKDPWEKFIPKQLQHFLSKKFNSCAAGFTCNAVWQKNKNTSLFPSLKEIIYSGINPQLLNTNPDISNDYYIISLIGSIYNKDILVKYLKLLQFWWKSIDVKHQQNIRFYYAGSDWLTVSDCISNLSSGFMDYTIHKFLPIDKMLQVCKSALVNTYIHNNECFHHKSIELMACSKPTMVYPNEDAEVVEISQKINNRIYIAGNKEEFINNMNLIWSNRDATPISANYEPYTWAAQSMNLLRYFKTI